MLKSQIKWRKKEGKKERKEGRKDSWKRDENEIKTDGTKEERYKLEI